MDPLKVRQWSSLDAIARRVVPEVAMLDEAGRQRFREVIGTALLQRPPSVRRQLGLLLDVIENAPRLRWLAPFSRLPAAHQDRVLRAFQEARPPRLRRGFWAVKTLVFMGYYAQPETAVAIGWTPARDGNARLHA